MATVQEILTTHLNNVKNKVAERMAARKASGRSAQSLVVEVSGDTGTLYGSASFLAMEKGRGPGPVPVGFNEIIRDWAIDKGISIQPKYQGQTQEGALNSFAGAVAHMIMTKGTRLFRSGQQEDIYSSIIADEIKQMGDDLVLSALDQVSIINQSMQ